MEKKSVIILILLITSGIFYYNYSPENTLQKVTVERVIDGDTIELENKIKVRLQGINTPEKGMPGYTEATNFLQTKIENKQISLETTGVDRYKRYLGYIFINNQNINQEILENGLGHLYYYEKDNHYQILAQAENNAQKKQIGIWKKSQQSNCLTLIKLDYYDKGDDHETLQLQNNCNKEINVIIKDDATHTYKEAIPEGNWQKTFKNIFNDNGDTIYIWDQEGQMILYYRY